MTFRSSQEELVHAFSRTLLGSQALFRPDYYRLGTREPADLVWAANRCAVIMHMTSGTKSLDRKRQHNHAQLHRWLRHWQQGELLSSKDQGISLRYEDVDFIIGLSVVGGAEACCVFEDDQVRYASNKLAVCATITDRVFEKLASYSVGILDAVHLLAAIWHVGGRMAEQQACDHLDAWVRLHAAAAREEFDPIRTTRENLEAAWRQTMFEGLKSIEGPVATAPILADLSVADAIWLSVAERSIAGQIALPGSFGPVVFAARRKLGMNTLVCAVLAHSSYLSKELFDSFGDASAILVSTLDFGEKSPGRLMVFPEDKMASRLTKALGDLREIAFAAR